MNTILHFFIIFIIIIFYFNIYEQNKSITSIEIYENDYTNNNELQKICKTDPIISNMNDLYIQPVDLSFNINLNDSKDKSNIIIPYESLNISLQQNKKNEYYTQHNFIYGEPEFSRFIKPPSCFFANLEILGGSSNAFTSCVTHNYYRRFLYVESGNISIHIKPRKDETVNPDYVNYIFNVTDTDTDTVNDSFTDFTISRGQMLYIPPNTIYKIVYNEPSILHKYSYHSISSILSNLNHICLYYIQTTNTENNTLLKKI